MGIYKSIIQEVISKVCHVWWTVLGWQIKLSLQSVPSELQAGRACSAVPRSECVCPSKLHVELSPPEEQYQQSEPLQLGLQGSASQTGLGLMSGLEQVNPAWSLASSMPPPPPSREVRAFVSSGWYSKQQRSGCQQISLLLATMLFAFLAGTVKIKILFFINCPLWDFCYKNGNRTLIKMSSFILVILVFSVTLVLLRQGLSLWATEVHDLQGKGELAVPVCWCSLNWTGSLNNRTVRCLLASTNC